MSVGPLQFGPKARDATGVKGAEVWGGAWRDGCPSKARCNDSAKISKGAVRTAKSVIRRRLRRRAQTLRRQIFTEFSRNHVRISSHWEHQPSSRFTRRRLVPRVGIEPTSQASEAYILSVELSGPDAKRICIKPENRLPVGTKDRIV